MERDRISLGAPEGKRGRITSFFQCVTPGKAAVLVFALYFIAGFLIVNDYGISADEVTERRTSLANYAYVAGEDIFNTDSEAARGVAAGVPNLRTFNNRFYGAALQSVPVLIEHLRGFEMASRDIYLTRHLFTFANYFLGGVFFYLILRRRFGNTWLPLLGTLLYILYPRFFGESFYNIKDILFYAWVVIASYFTLRWLEDGRLRFAAPAAIALAVAINTRILGLSLLLLGCVFAPILEIRRKKGLIRAVAKPAALGALTFACYVAITPFLWENPLQNAYRTFIHFLDFQPWNGTHFYLGEMITREVPWHYIPVWMGVTVPILYLVMFLGGVAALCGGLFAWIRRMPEGRAAGLEKGELREPAQTSRLASAPGMRFYDLFFAVLFFATLAGYILLRISMYEGWRHAYGIFCPFLYLAVFGLERALAFARGKRRVLRYGFACAVAACLVSQLVWIVCNHPYQYVYFNALGRQIAEENFALDFWRVSHAGLIRYALANDERLELIFGGYGVAKEHAFLTEEEKARVILSEAVPADYFVQDTARAYRSRNIPSGFEEIYAITVDGMKISRLFRRVAPPAGFDASAWNHVVRFEGNGEEADSAVLHDGDYATLWNTGRPKEPGDTMMFAFDTAVDYDYVSLTVTQHVSIYDYPLNLSLSISTDGILWTDMETLSPIASDYQMAGKPDPYRFLRLENKDPGGMDGYWWSVGEMRFGHAR